MNYPSAAFEETGINHKTFMNNWGNIFGGSNAFLFEERILS